MLRLQWTTIQSQPDPAGNFPLLDRLSALELQFAQLSIHETKKIDAQPFMGNFSLDAGYAPSEEPPLDPVPTWFADGAFSV